MKRWVQILNCFKIVGLPNDLLYSHHNIVWGCFAMLGVIDFPVWFVVKEIFSIHLMHWSSLSDAQRAWVSIRLSNGFPETKDHKRPRLFPNSLVLVGCNVLV